MAKNKIYTVAYRRKREGKTNYKKRIALLKSQKSRLVVRLSLKHVTIQIIQFNPEGDRVLVSAHTSELGKLGWGASTGNIPGAYLVGFILGKKALAKNINEAILDIGLRTSVKGSRVYAALKGASDAGLKVPFSEEIVPSDNRIMGKHVADYALTLSKNQDAYKKQYSQYMKRLLKPEQLPEHFGEIKKKIEVSIK